MTIIMTCKIGRFEFPDDTVPSLAKVVRDTVMGQMLCPKQRTMDVRTEEDAYAFMRANDSQELSRIGFKLTLAEGGSDKLTQAISRLATAADVVSDDIFQVAKAFGLTMPAVRKMVALVTGDPVLV